MAKNKLHKGDKVMTADGRILGTVKTLDDTCIHIQAPGRRDYWLARDAVQASTGGVTLLSLDQGALKDATITTESHNGMHSHEKSSGGGGGGKSGMTGMLTSPMFLLLSTAILTMRKKENRDKVMSAVKQMQGKMKPAVDDMSHTMGDKLDDAADKLDNVAGKLSAQGKGGGNASGTGMQDLSAMKPPAAVAKDKVDEASWESFPASDPPSR